MKFTLYQLEFLTGVHFGSGNLDRTECTFRADTLFSALFLEAMKMGREQELLSAAEQGHLLFSDALPYIEGCYYIPKPMISLAPTEKKQGNSGEKKKYKNLKYIPWDALPEYRNGIFQERYLDDMKKLGNYGMKVSVNLKDNEEPEPYMVSTFGFHDRCGLYMIVAYREEDELSLFDTLMESLQYSGIGGKRSSGLGRFEYLQKALPEEMCASLEKKSEEKLLLSTSIPEDQELEEAMDGASYLLVKRGGFVASSTYASQQMRKRELYLFSSGSCFKNAFVGKLIKEENGGTHPVYRYAKALFMGI